MILNFKIKDYKCQYFAGSRFIEGACFSSGCSDGKFPHDPSHTCITYMWSKQPDELNYCFLDRNTMLRYFIVLSKKFGFKIISFSENDKRYKLQIDVINERRYFIYVSMYIRYVYEFPFSLALYCALQNHYNFPELDITNIIQFYIALFHDGNRCHCPGLNHLAYYNLNCKSIFNNLRDDFNYANCFCEIESNHTGLLAKLRKFNEKNLPEIVSGINNIANKYYVKSKKNICRW